MNTETTDKGEYTFKKFANSRSDEQKAYMVNLLKNAQVANINNLDRLNQMYGYSDALIETPRYKQRTAEKQLIESILKELGI